MMDHSVRWRLELAEEQLSPLAARSARSRGRQVSEDPCSLRTDFQRDRDRIIFSNAFRRLKHKTQVFIAPLGDHYVTRLTHTLEVSQIARTVTRALMLNEDLAEAIALGHDLGHTPFGHIGEQVLDSLLDDGFRHYEQSLRVVDYIERNGRGLNLTWEVRDGILNHSKGDTEIPQQGWGNVSTVEGQVVKMADLVAYINHDTEDAIRAGLISHKDLPISTLAELGQTNSERINTLVTDIVAFSSNNMAGAHQSDAVIGMSARVRHATNELRDFLFEKVYYAGLDEPQAARARRIVRQLFDYFLEHPDQLPAEYNNDEESTGRRVADYIAGMTDHYAILTAEKLAL
jgi:dGTPase